MVATTSLWSVPQTSALVHPAILDDPESASKDVVGLLGHSVTVPILGVRNPQSLGPSKVPVKEAIFASGISPRAMETDRHLVASSITNRYSEYLVGISVCHRCEFGVEPLSLSHNK